jgi:aarF domain-containing kinase
VSGRSLNFLRTLGSTAIKAGFENVKQKIQGKNLAESPPGAIEPTSAAALRFVKGLDELKGAAMKMGQLVSMLDSDMLPPGWKNVLGQLQSQATPKPWSEVNLILKEHLGNKIEDFEHIDEKAVHAASIGQVHKGKLKNGTLVAIKIRYPNLENWIEEDLKNMKRLIKLVGVLPIDGRTEPIFEQIEKILRQEMDFEQEAQHYVSYEKFLQNETDRIVSPSPILNYCNSHVLVTKWVEGKSIDNWMKENDPLKDSENPQVSHIRNSLGENLLRFLFLELFHYRQVQTDPNPANFLVSPEGKLIVLDFGATQKLTTEFSDKYKALIHACAFRSKKETQQAALNLGLLKSTDSEKAMDYFTSMMAIANEPFEHFEYSWKNSDVLKRANVIGTKFVFEVKFRAPPPEFIFINRRIIGLQLTLEKLGSKINAKGLLKGFVCE